MVISTPRPHEDQQTGSDLDECDQPVWRVGGRLRCTLQPLLQGLHAQLIYLSLHLLLLSPAAYINAFISAESSTERIYWGLAICKMSAHLMVALSSLLPGILS